MSEKKEISPIFKILQVVAWGLFSATLVKYSSMIGLPKPDNGLLYLGEFVVATIIQVLLLFGTTLSLTGLRMLVGWIFNLKGEFFKPTTGDWENFSDATWTIMKLVFTPILFIGDRLARRAPHKEPEDPDILQKAETELDQFLKEDEFATLEKKS